MPLEAQLNALIKKYEKNRGSWHTLKPWMHALLSVNRKVLRKILLEVFAMDGCYEQRFYSPKETQKDLKDTEGFDWWESTELANKPQKNWTCLF